MYEVVLEKFRQNRGCQDTLLRTGDAPLVEDTTTDTYWGWGTDHKGKNKLGQILEAVRDYIRREIA